MSILQTRRRLVTSASAAGVAGLLGSAPALADEGPPETTTIRLRYDPNICLSPAYIAEGLLRAEGFAEVRYIRTQPSRYDDAMIRDDIDFDFATAAVLAVFLDAGKPITALAGVHPGCYELFAHEPIRT